MLTTKKKLQFSRRVYEYPLTESPAEEPSMLVANAFGPLFAQEAAPGVSELPLGPKLGIAFAAVVLGLLLWG